MLRLFAILAFSASASLLTAPASATTFPVQLDSHGVTNPGIHFADECDEGERRYLVGFSARVGQWFDQIAPICAAFSPTGDLSDTKAGEGHGGTGGLPRAQACPPNAFLTGIRFGRARTGDSLAEEYVGFVELHCTAIDGAESTICMGGEDGCYGVLRLSGGAGSIVLTPAVQTCPSGEAATGIQGGAREFVGALGLICGPAPAGIDVATKPETPADVLKKGPIVATGPADVLKPGDVFKQGPIVANPPEPPPAPPPTPGPVTDVCGPPGGNAVVTIADPKLTRLNVRTEPGGPVLGTIREGAEVTVIGPCGPAGSAGIVAPEQTVTGSGWCQIEQPIAGCVSAQFLALGETGGAAGLAKPPEPESSPAESSEAGKAPQPGPVVTGTGCDLPPGPATIVIPEPNLKKLNVRESPGGNVITTIPEGGQVSIVGECGSEIAAGIVAPSEEGGAPGWCQIDSPVTGCVSAKYLVPGSDGAAGIVVPPEETSLQPSFEGAWDTLADGVPHSVTLSQNGSSVSGEYAADDGSNGTIAGKVKGNVLRFSWSQADGVSGKGKFTLSDDGESFAGSYSIDGNLDASGSWDGQRQ